METPIQIRENLVRPLPFGHCFLSRNFFVTASLFMGTCIYTAAIAGPGQTGVECTVQKYHQGSLHVLLKLPTRLIKEGGLWLLPSWTVQGSPSTPGCQVNTARVTVYVTTRTSDTQPYCCMPHKFEFLMSDAVLKLDLKTDLLETVLRFFFDFL